MSQSYDTNAQSITTEDLEARMQVMEDTKKRVSYFKFTGKWAWFDRADEGDLDNYHEGFDTAWEAILDATEPYFEDDEEEEE